MKKQIALLVSAAACAGLFAETATDEYTDKYDKWFSGIGSGATKEDLKPSSAAWDFTAVTGESDYVVRDGKLELKLQSGVVAKLTPVADKAPDTNTITKVTVNTTFEPVEDEPVAEDAAEAQTAIVVYNNQYWVWNGTAWSAISDVTPMIEQAVDMTVEISYQDMKAKNPVRTAKYTIGEDDFEVTLATTNNALEYITCGGIATIASIDGTVMEGVAVANEKKFGTVAEAVAEAKTAEVKGVLLVRDTDEPIAADKDVVIDMNGKTTGEITIPENQKLEVAYGAEPSAESTASGAKEVPVNVAAGTSLEQVEVTLLDDSKEVKDGSKEFVIKDSNKYLKFEVQTSAAVLSKVKPDGSKALAVNDNYRAFLSEHVGEAYTEAHADSSKIEDALKGTGPGTGTNELPLWKDYVMGIEPMDSVAPVSAPAGDTASDGITLSIPAVAAAIKAGKHSGDYDLSFKAVNVETQEETASTSADEITIPLKTGKYMVKVVFTEPAK